MNPRTLIIGLHRVGRPPASAKIRGLFTTPRLLTFELWLLRILGYHFATLSEAMNGASGKSAVITFDDGYSDNIQNALPILERFGAPATIFVITSDVGMHGVVWDEAGEKLPADLLGWNDLRELQSRGWEIGSHGHHHVHFDRRSAESQESLVCHSVFQIEDKLGTVPISFAYPYGVYNETTKDILRHFGIRYAVTTQPYDRKQEWDSLELRRLSIGGRHFYHYMRVFWRTIKCVGVGESLRALLPDRIEQARFSIVARLKD
jgi:peptidoglycan/xylan/chitin deacetylase (PgdA/CDA1 family)